VTALTPRCGVIPIVSDANALDDARWFADHPERQFRLRDGLVVRRRGRGIFLRTPTSMSADPESERLAERIWWLAAHSSPSPPARHELMKAARRRQPGEQS
jgi:hypothetical protein